MAGQHRRDTTPESRFTAAWGNPAIVLRCGVARPPALTAVSPQIVELAPPGAGPDASVEWFLEPGASGTVATTVHRATYVQVRVPPDYGPDVNALVDLVPAIVAADAASDAPLPLPTTTPAG